MSESSKRLALEATSAISEHRLELIDGLIHPDYHDHELAADRPGGPEGFKTTVEILHRAFSDTRFEPHDVIAEDDRVAVRGQFSARHVGPFSGMSATGRLLSIQQIHVWRIASGKLVEHWAVIDGIQALRQLGLLRSVAHTGGVR